jgi:hypothetical protein
VLLDHADQADSDLLPELRRWLQLADDNRQIVTIISSRSPAPAQLASAIDDFIDLRTDVQPLSMDEASEFLAGWTRDEAVDPSSFGIDAAAALHRLTGGKPRELARLLRLSALASQAEGGARMDAAAIEALRAELIA